MSLNHESLRLMRHLDTLSDEPAPMADMSRFSAQAAAFHAKQNAPTVFQRTKDLFSWLENKASSPISKAVQKATALGLAVPFDRDIAKYDGMKKNLKSMRLRLTSAKDTQLGRLLALRDPRADLFVTNQSKEVSIAIDSIDRATAACDKAQATAQSARKVITGGGIPVQYTAIYAVQKNLANTAYNRAIGGATKTYSDIQAFVKEMAKPTGSVLNTSGQVLTNFGSRVSGAAQFAGEEAEEIAKAVKKGAPALNKALEYWPWVLGAGAALYAYQFLPKPAKKP